MPTYELAFLVRAMSKPETAVVLKRTAQEIFDKGGFIRAIHNLGTKDTPHKVTVHNQLFVKAQYFVYEFEVPLKSLPDIHEVCGRDVDILRRGIFRHNPYETEKTPCTIYEETLPPAYRADVQKLVEISQKKQKKLWNNNTGLKVPPF